MAAEHRSDGRRGETLELRDLADLGEFIGGIVVVVSLAYLAIQVRQNTDSIRAENFARVLDRISATQSALSQDKEFSTLHARGVADTASLSPQERIRFTWWFVEAFGAFEFIFHQAKVGAIPDEIWARWSATISWWLSYPGVQEWWRASPAPFSKSFTSFVEARLAEASRDPETDARWQAFLTQPQRGAGHSAVQQAVEPGAE